MVAMVRCVERTDHRASGERIERFCGLPGAAARHSEQAQREDRQRFHGGDGAMCGALSPVLTAKPNQAFLIRRHSDIDAGAGAILIEGDQARIVTFAGRGPPITLTD
jgi:hypothetical protein